MKRTALWRGSLIACAPFDGLDVGVPRRRRVTRLIQADGLVRLTFEGRALPEPARCPRPARKPPVPPDEPAVAPLRRPETPAAWDRRAGRTSRPWRRRAASDHRRPARRGTRSPRPGR